MVPDIREQLRRAARDPGDDLDPAALRRRAGRRWRRRAGRPGPGRPAGRPGPLGQVGLERPRQLAGVVDRAARPAATTPAPPNSSSPPQPPPRSAALVRPAPLLTPEQAFRALARLPAGWTSLPAPPQARRRPSRCGSATPVSLGRCVAGRGPRRRLGGSDPVARRWHPLRPCWPGGRWPPGSGPAAVLVWGGSRVSAFADGAAYDPATGARAAAAGATVGAGHRLDRDRAARLGAAPAATLRACATGPRSIPGRTGGGRSRPPRSPSTWPAGRARAPSGPAGSWSWSGRSWTATTPGSAARHRAGLRPWRPTGWRRLPDVRLSAQATAAA